MVLITTAKSYHVCEMKCMIYTYFLKIDHFHIGHLLIASLLYGLLRLESNTNPTIFIELNLTLSAISDYCIFLKF